jgi:flagellar basal-body rod modification protein FlgD
MSVSAVSSSTAVGTPTAAQLAALNSATAAEGGQTTLGQNDFLNLLTTQLENQDPMNPQSDTDFIAQMATFSQLQSMNTLNTNFSSYSTADSVTNAANLIGKTVSVTGTSEGTGTASGAVTGVSVSGGNTELTIGGKDYLASEITSIQAATSSSSSSSSTN